LGSERLTPNGRERSIWIGNFCSFDLRKSRPAPPFLQPIVQAVESLCLKNQRPPPVLRILNVLFDLAFLLPRGRISERRPISIVVHHCEEAIIEGALFAMPNLIDRAATR
jgi:hypothetical protein